MQSFQSMRIIFSNLSAAFIIEDTTDIHLLNRLHIFKPSEIPIFIKKKLKYKRLSLVGYS